jgi:hypothetical protein
VKSLRPLQGVVETLRRKLRQLEAIIGRAAA